MRKIWVLCALLVFLLALPVSAEKIKFKDPNYDFKNYSSILNMGTSSVQIDNTDFVVDEGAADKLRMSLLSSFSKKKRTVVEQEKVGEIGPKLGFTSKIFIFGNDKIWHDAWTELVHTSKTIYVDDYDNKGHRRTKSVTIPITEDVYHPAGYYYTARVDIEFDVKDLRNDKLVYSVRDTRSRGGEQDTSGMLKRICNDFVDDIAK